MSKSTTLYSPDGVKYATSSRAEVTRLKARGYSETPPKKAAPKADAPKS